ncbi:hypothetical protein SEA_PEGGYLEG03_36 [Arthrobacter phage PeggyLeg03]|nr:hypothetical protein SEA_PEGGYLEG03_36 [Arthrobacter phage PeggyLeg03]
MGDPIRAVVGCGPDGCGQYAMRGDVVGDVVNTVALPDGEVWEIDWPDGSKDLWWNANSG